MTQYCFTGTKVQILTLQAPAGDEEECGASAQ
jgi:hypothetical protein